MSNLTDTVTWWLYIGRTVVGCTRCDRRATPEQVRRQALDELDANPGVVTPTGLAPFEQRARLMRAHIYH